MDTNTNPNPNITEEKLDKILSLLQNLEKRVTELEYKKNPKNFLQCAYCELKKEDVSSRHCRGYENKCRYLVHSCYECDMKNLKSDLWCNHD